MPKLNEDAKAVLREAIGRELTGEGGGDGS